MSFWDVVDTGENSAEENMRFDAALLQNADSYQRPILHFYEWRQKSATYGHFIQPGVFLDLQKAKDCGLDLARRPTGGGIIFHLWDMAFSILVPAHLPEYSINTLDNYAFVNLAVLRAIENFLGESMPLYLIKEDAASQDSSCAHFCMAKPTKYDVLLGEKKVVGAAQRKTKKGFLHQGSISLVMPSRDFLEQVLLAGDRVNQALFMHTHPLLGPSAGPVKMAEAKETLKRLLATHLNQASLKYHS